MNLFLDISQVSQVSLSDLYIAPLRTRHEARAFLDAYHYLGGRGVPVAPALRGR